MAFTDYNPDKFEICEYVGHLLQAQTKVKLGATAGLRLLPDGKADAILAAVRSYLATSPFELDRDTGVTILDGIVSLLCECFCCPATKASACVGYLDKHVSHL